MVLQNAIEQPYKFVCVCLAKLKNEVKFEFYDHGHSVERIFDAFNMFDYGSSLLLLKNPIYLSGTCVINSTMHGIDT